MPVLPDMRVTVEEVKQIEAELRKNASPFSRVKLSDYVSIKLDGENDAIKIKVLVPMDDQMSAEYSEIIEFNADTPQWLKDAAVEWSKAVDRALKERVVKQRQLPCETCKATCCTEWQVRVTEEDLKRFAVHDYNLPPGTAGLEQHVIFWDGGSFENSKESWNGFVGELRKKPNSVECIFLDPKGRGCTIYEHRPQVCRDFSAWTCDRFEEDPDKKNGLIQLRIPQK